MALRRNGGAYQSKLVLCLRGKRTFFLPAEHTPITASGSLCLLQVSQPNRATKESCLIVNASRESWWLFQIAGFFFFYRSWEEEKKKNKNNIRSTTLGLFLKSIYFCVLVEMKLLPAKSIPIVVTKSWGPSRVIHGSQRSKKKTKTKGPHSISLRPPRWVKA